MFRKRQRYLTNFVIYFTVIYTTGMPQLKIRMFRVVVRCGRTPPVYEGVQLRDTYNKGKKSMGFVQQGSSMNS